MLFNNFFLHNATNGKRLFTLFIQEKVSVTVKISHPNWGRQKRGYIFSHDTHNFFEFNQLQIPVILSSAINKTQQQFLNLTSLTSP